MQELSAANKWAKEIRQYKPIDTEGFRLYPIRVAEYELLLIAKPAIEFMTQTLSVEYMSTPLLQSFYAMDLDRTLRGEPPTGLFTSAVVSLALALRLVSDGNIETLMDRCMIVAYPDDHTRLKQITFIFDDGSEKSVTPIQFARLRPIIAAQNGLEIPPESANPELLEAERDIAAKKAPKLKVSIDALIQGVCCVAGVSEDEVEEWAILKLHNRMESFKRILDYTICSIGATQGTTWKGGNPCPSPWFDKDEDNSSALIDMSTFAGGQGLKAIQESGAI